MRSIASNYGHELRDLPEIQGNATAFNSYPTGPWQLMGTNLAIVGFWPTAAILYVAFGAGWPTCGSRFPNLWLPCCFALGWNIYVDCVNTRPGCLDAIHRIFKRKFRIDSGHVF